MMTDTAAADEHEFAAPDPAWPAVKAKLVGGSTPLVITGAGGWLGQALIAEFDHLLSREAFDHRVRLFGSSNRQHMLPSGRAVAVHRLESLDEATFGPAHYFHFAFLTMDRLRSVQPDAFRTTNVAIGDIVASAMRRNGLKGLFVPSSGAVYRRGTLVVEDDVAANPYGTAKIADERRFKDLAAQLSAPACFPRVFNLAGPFINKVEIYALGSMITDVLAGRPIEIRATHPVVRSYLHVTDLLRLAFGCLFAPLSNAPAVFDTAGERTVELSELAALVSQVLQRPTSISRPPLDPVRVPDRYVGDSHAMLNLCLHYGITLRPLETQIADTAHYLSQTSAQEQGV